MNCTRRSDKKTNGEITSFFHFLDMIAPRCLQLGKYAVYIRSTEWQKIADTGVGARIRYDAGDLYMKEFGDIVTFQGNPLTLIGDVPRVGQIAPNATLLDNELNEVKLSDFGGKIRILSVAPSLDTPVCDMQTRRFNQEADRLGDVVILAISMDLPFAQKRWCGAAGVKAVRTLSDHRDCEFGLTYGLLIKELRLLARAVLVLDGEGTVRYVQVVPEVTDEPDYAAALKIVAELNPT